MKIDAFAHVMPESYLGRVDALLSAADVSEKVKLFQPWLHEDPVLFDLDARWRALEPFEDYRQILVLAVPPLEELGSPRLTAELARLANDEMADLVRSHADRFAGFVAALPLNDVEASLLELERATNELGAAGVQLYSNVSGAPLDDPRFDPLFKEVSNSGHAIWLHPTRSPAWPDYPTEPESRFGIWWSLGWPYETAVAMARLVYSGHLERYRGLRIVTHHAGAMVPHFASRLATLQSEDQRDPLARLRRSPLDYFRRFYADTALFGAAHALRCSVDFFGADHVLFGTDMPLGGPGVIEATIKDVEALGLPAEDTEQIFSGNALQLPGVAVG